MPNPDNKKPAEIRQSRAGAVSPIIPSSQELDIKEKLLDLPKPREQEAKYLIQAELDDLVTSIQQLINRAVISELEKIKQWNGAFIGIDGRRVEKIVSHKFIEDRIAELKAQQPM